MAPPRGQDRPASSSRPWWATLLGAAGVVGLLGGPLGVAWFFLAPQIRFDVTDAGVVRDPRNPDDWFGRDGWFLVCGLVVGVLAAVVVRRVFGPAGPAAVLGATVGGGVAAALGLLVGRWLGPPPLPSDVTNLAPGAVVSAPLAVLAPAVLGSVSFAVVLVLGLGVALERRPAQPPSQPPSQPPDVTTTASAAS